MKVGNPVFQLALVAPRHWTLVPLFKKENRKQKKKTKNSKRAAHEGWLRRVDERSGSFGFMTHGTFFVSMKANGYHGVTDVVQKKQDIMHMLHPALHALKYLHVIR